MVFIPLPSKPIVANTACRELGVSPFSMADRVAKMVKEKPVVIFSKSTCCMSHTIKTLISDFGANATVYEIDEIPKGKEVEQGLASRGCNPAVPVVFIGGEFVGGANEVMSLHLNRSLVPMLKSAGALWL
ncbi:hypothetical protein MLD38_016329 [Melastoma candidum]|uniref:Uncharacterized protein n=1 Tax=Melastoma candidum TaxID=119954 RepID=A0ACB9RJ48_9MYRT|nr:hypothetical protein MLD38_016329 [Melastoma candidum]